MNAHAEALKIVSATSSQCMHAIMFCYILLFVRLFYCIARALFAQVKLSSALSDQLPRSCSWLQSWHWPHIRSYSYSICRLVIFWKQPEPASACLPDSIATQGSSWLQQHTLWPHPRGVGSVPGEVRSAHRCTTFWYSIVTLDASSSYRMWWQIVLVNCVAAHPGRHVIWQCCGSTHWCRIAIVLCEQVNVLDTHWKWPAAVQVLTCLINGHRLPSPDKVVRRGRIAHIWLYMWLSHHMYITCTCSVITCKSHFAKSVVHLMHVAR